MNDIIHKIASRALWNADLEVALQEILHRVEVLGTIIVSMDLTTKQRDTIQICLHEIEDITYVTLHPELFDDDESEAQS